MKLAAIDIGSNSVHMIIVETRGEHSFEVIDREKDMIFLGRSVFEHGSLTPEAFAAGLEVLERYQQLARRHGVDETLAVATAATREAENGGDFLQAIAERTGIQVRIITGLEEARTIYLGVRHALDLSERTALVLDIGGGSVEAIVGDARKLRVARSMKLGVQRLRAMFGRGGPLGKKERRDLEAHIKDAARPVLREARGVGFDFVVGCSGTIQSLGEASLRLAGQEPGVQPSGQVVPVAALRELTDRLTVATALERATLAGVEARRADTLHVGGVLLCTLLELCEAPGFTLSDAALREGLILDYLERQSATVHAYDVVRDVRGHSVMELARRCGQTSAHPEHVARLALQLFDQLVDLHGLGDAERKLLEYGAILHDVGQHIGYERHEHHAAYIIRNAELRGFSDQDREVLALLGRYHRKSRPKQKDVEFARLPQRVRRSVIVLSGILRLADGLDRSHHQLISELRVLRRGPALEVVAAATGEDAELELWGARRKGKLLERALGRPLTLSLRGGLPSAPLEESPVPPAAVEAPA